MLSLHGSMDRQWHWRCSSLCLCLSVYLSIFLSFSHLVNGHVECSRPDHGSPRPHRGGPPLARHHPWRSQDAAGGEAGSTTSSWTLPGRPFPPLYGASSPRNLLYTSDSDAVVPNNNFSSFIVTCIFHGLLSRKRRGNELLPNAGVSGHGEFTSVLTERDPVDRPLLSQALRFLIFEI